MTPLGRENIHGSLISPHSGCQHKAWGVSPRIETRNMIEPASGRQPWEFQIMIPKQCVFAKPAQSFGLLPAHLAGSVISS
jgi:hypothetical protein